MPTFIFTSSDTSTFLAAAEKARTQLEAAMNEMVLTDLNSDNAPAPTAIDKVECCDCGDEFLPSELIEIGSGDEVCQDCIGNYTFCDEQQDYFPEDEFIVLYDGDSRRCQNGARTLHESASQRMSTFCCDYCNEQFYNSGVYLQDREETYCRSCAEDHCYRCSGCDNWYSDDDSCECCYDRETEPADNHQIGTVFTRFSQRPVGLELDTGRGGQDRSFIEAVHRRISSWGAKSDGSLRDGGYEFVSAPMTGNRIEEDYRAWVEVAKDHGVTRECQRAGYHVHVNAKDLFRTIKVLWQGGDAERREADSREDLICAWGDMMTVAVKELVSNNRRYNEYCRGSFGTRGGYDHHSLRKISGCSYPAVAVRDQTFEFRIFPSTEATKWHLARIEFVQKSVDYLYKLMTERTLSRAKASIALMTARMAQLRGAARVKFLARIFGITLESRESLMAMHERYNKQQYTELPAVSTWGDEDCDYQYEREGELVAA